VLSRTARRSARGECPAPVDLAWSPDGQHIAFVQGQVWMVEVRDHSLRQLTFGNNGPRFPTWDNDSRHVFYSGRSGLQILDTVDGSERPFLHGDSMITRIGTPARMSPDGQRLTFAVAVTETTGQVPNRDIRTIRELVVVDRDGSNYRRITSLHQHSAWPQWWSDSRRIFFDRAPYECGPNQNGRSTWVINEDGTGLRKWSANLGDNDVQFGFPFALSPDGTRAAFIGKDSTRTLGVLCIRNLDGTCRKQLTSF
jgi:Tol biopolymer transport system component